jgi:hypothetical protein
MNTIGAVIDSSLGYHQEQLLASLKSSRWSPVQHKLEPQSLGSWSRALHYPMERHVFADDH